MNFNLALICTDGTFADARVLCASCSSPTPICGEPSPSLRLRSPVGSLQPLLVQRCQLPAETQGAQKMGKSFGNTRYYAHVVQDVVQVERPLSFQGPQ